ncbi:hypothetical protein A3H80_05095 [Candidatus Roizmanbacteria bacterium RIFCSPLOWO2_02_FULL_37_19]|nr:MAG: hypothetical protein A3H80_05095 [Candidatus Roizmanbacteria bacterium RIFCSPLOWO2_02_FULL_37_19]
MAKVTCITTVLNEEKTIKAFLDSLLQQSKKPDEIIIVDGGSIDRTIEIAKKYVSKFSNLTAGWRSQISIYIIYGNRSVGRNYAISKASHELIAVSDVGCILDADWLKNIIQPFEQDASVDVVAGYYSPNIGKPTIFQQCLATYTCIMPDKFTEDFLPSSRSIAFKKSAWKKVGGYPEELDTCEDLVFAKKMKFSSFNFQISNHAIVFWPQKENLWQAFKQFFNYAKGDGRALYIRPTTPFLFLRYVVGLIILYAFLKTSSPTLLSLLCMLFIAYIIWAVVKNYHYIKHWKAFTYLPLLQVMSDIAVIAGMTVGFVSRFINV